MAGRTLPFAVLPLLGGVQGGGLSPDVGQLPAMGFNTWNNFRCDGVSADNIIAIADALVQSGLAAAGYAYLNVDDCWSAPNLRQDGALQPLPDAFPHGIRALADAIHLRGLKFGLYADRGYKTCAFHPGSRGHEYLHAQQFAEWHVDYLKYDSCFAPNIRRKGALDDYRRMREALNATGRPVLFSACGWNWWYSPHTDVAHSVRIAADCDEWANVYEAARTNEYLALYATKGHFNDPDMLLGSSPGASAMLTPQRSRAQFALWAVMTAPLLLGLDIFHMTDFDKETYTNLEIIAIDQDRLAVQGIVALSTCPPWTLKDYWWCSPWSMPAEIRAQWSRALLTCALITFSLCFLFRRKRFAFIAACCFAYVLILHIYTPVVHPCVQVWTKPLSNGDAAVVFINWDGPRRSVTCDAACLAYFLGDVSPTPKFCGGLALSIITTVVMMRRHARANVAVLDYTDPTAAAMTVSLGANGDARIFRLISTEDALDGYTDTSSL